MQNCRRKIWECVGEAEISQPQAKRVKSETISEVEDDKPKDTNTHATIITTSQSQPSVGVNKGVNRADIEFKINAMKVVEMRDECRRLGLDNKGVKKVLRARLLEHMLSDDGSEGEDMVIEQNMEDSKQATNATEQAVENQNIPEETKVTNEQTAPETRMSCDSIKVDHHEPTVAIADEVEQKPSADPKKDKPVPETKEKQGSIKSKSPIKTQLQLAQKGSVQAEYYKDSIPEDDISPPSSEVTTSSVASKISGTKVREIVSKLSSNKSQYSSATPSSSASSGSALLKSVQAKKEARMARMAEIREKVSQDPSNILSLTTGLCISSCSFFLMHQSQQAKTFTSSKPHSNTELTQASMNSTLVSSSLGSTLKSYTGKKNLAAQMREKALRKENVPANSNLVSSASQVKRALPLNQSNIQDTLGNTMKSGLGSTLKYGMASSKVPKVASPMDTYEISDREDSDSDASDSDDEKKKKKIPLWAKKENLLPALEQQYLGKDLDGKRVDPDDIFPEVESCNLEAIFGSKKNSRYRSRTSSGNWSQDQVTAAEKLVYKRTMGFTVESSEI